MNPFIEHEEHEIKYLKEYNDEIVDYISRVILEVFHGVSKNIGINNPDKLASKPPGLQKGFLDGLMNIGKKFTGLKKKISEKMRRIKPFSVEGGYLFKKGRYLTYKDWKKFESQIIDYMSPYLNDVHEEMAVKGILLAIASAESEKQKEHIEKYGMKSLKQIDKDVYKNKMPGNFKEFEKSEHYKKDTEKAIMQAYNDCAIHVQKVKEDVRDAIREQVIAAHKAGKTPQQLASDLYWMKDENPDMKKYTAQSLLRDWQRVSTTELAMIHAAGKLGANESDARESIQNPEKAVYMMFQGGTCEWCQAHQGTVLRQIPMEMVGAENNDSLASRGIKDPHTNLAVWQGKNNVGYKKAMWRVCTPAHPWNTAQLVRFNPDLEEFDKKTGRIRAKSTEEMKELMPDEFKKEHDRIRDQIEKREAEKETDREKNIHKKPIEYIERKGKIIGTDSQGRDIADDDGQMYVAVSPEDFQKELEAWRKDTSRPIPIATNQREYQNIFKG